MYSHELGQVGSLLEITKKTRGMVIHCYTTSVGLGEALPQNVIPFTQEISCKARPEVQQTIDAGKKAEFGNKFFIVFPCKTVLMTFAHSNCRLMSAPVGQVDGL